MRARGIPLLVGLVIFAAGCVRIDSGRAGLLWKWIGGTQQDVYGEGVHIVAPWNRMYVYDIRTQDRKEELHILTNNGLSVSLEASIRFRPNRQELPNQHIQIGPRYFDAIPVGRLPRFLGIDRP